MLILDECQKLLIARNPDIRDIFEFLKDFCTKANWHGDLRTQLVLCGTRDGVPLLKSADWVQGRTKTIKLNPLNGTEFAQLLIKIYLDYVQFGISKEWALISEYNGQRSLNIELAQYFHTRTKGKVGLTVDLIRNSILLALDKGKLCPTQEEYEQIKLSDKSVIMKKKGIRSQSKFIPNKRKIKITFHDRECCIMGCKRNGDPYKRYSYLIDHYKRKHPEIDLDYEE